MKKIIYSALAIAAMVSCTSQEELIEEGDLVEIKLQGGISAIETKAALGNGSALDAFTLLRYDATDVPADFTTPTGTAITDASMNTSGEITLATKQYYNFDGTQNTYFVGFYPNATTAPTTNEVTLPVDGQTDIMAFDCINTGNKVTPGTDAIAFKHMLTQLVFKVKGDAASATNFGTITSIQVKDQPDKVKLTLGTLATLTNESTTANIYAYNDDGKMDNAAISIPADETEIGYALIAPLATSESTHTYVLSIKTSNLATAQDVNVKVDEQTPGTGAAPAGKKVIITLTFSQKEIAGSGAIADWTEVGGTGSGSIQ